MIIDSFSLNTKIKNTLQIISFGKSHWIKGYMHALDACKLLKVKGINFNYLIVGGADDMELIYQIHELELQAEVQLLEMQSLESLQLMMQKADVLFLPSLKEDRADIALQAMATNLIVLSTDCDFTKDLIIHGNTGFIAPMRDSHKMAEALELIKNLSDSEKRRIQENARQIVQVNYDK